MMRRLLLLIGAVSLAGCFDLGAGPNAGTPSDPATETFSPVTKVNIANMTKLEPSGVYIEDLSPGTGATLTDSLATVTIDYNAYLKNGFLWSSSASGPVSFSLAGEIQGLQIGMVGMKVGGERLIVIPSALAFGDALVANVPQNSTQVWDVKLEIID